MPRHLRRASRQGQRRSSAMYDPSSDSEDYDQRQSQLAPNPALRLAEHPRIILLRSVLGEHSFCCCGTADVPETASGLVLFYGKDERAR